MGDKVTGRAIVANLTPKQELFIREYLIDFNATQAAKRAGYSEASSYAIGQENLKKPVIKEAIEALVNDLLGPPEKDIIENVNYWRSVRDNAEASGSDRNKASELLGKYRTMFKEHIEINKRTEVIFSSEDEGLL